LGDCSKCVFHQAASNLAGQIEKEKVTKSQGGTP